MSLELAVSQALMRAHVMERALYDDGPWHIKVDTDLIKIVMLAQRSVSADAVMFSIPLWVEGSTEGSATLFCDGEAVLVRPISLEHGSGTVHVDWELRLSDAVTA